MVSFYLLIIIVNIWGSLHPLAKHGLLGAWCFIFPNVSKWWSQDSELAAVFLPTQVVLGGAVICFQLSEVTGFRDRNELPIRALGNMQPSLALVQLLHSTQMSASRTSIKYFRTMIFRNILEIVFVLQTSLYYALARKSIGMYTPNMYL